MIQRFLTSTSRRATFLRFACVGGVLAMCFNYICSHHLVFDT